MNYRYRIIPALCCSLSLSALAVAQPIPASPGASQAQEVSPGGKEGHPVQLPPMTVAAPKLPIEKYTVSTATTATKTDTPILETPTSIQVVPRQVLDDQQVISVKDALRNVSGVQPGAYEFYDVFTIRGFATGYGQTFRNGLQQQAITGLETANLEQIEVLKGPAAMLYGRIEPGGLVNLVTKKPLAQPYYSLQQQFGSYQFYRTTFDATGPLLADKSLLYRFNLAYRDNNTFRDFVGQNHIFVAPSLTWRPTTAFELNFDLEYQDDDFVDDGSDGGIPAIGKRPARIPISRYLADPVNQKFPNQQQRILVAFNWSYHLTDNWTLTHRFHTDQRTNNQNIIYPIDLSDEGIQNRGLWHVHFDREFYATNLDLTGRLNTWGVQHQLLVGGDYWHYNDIDIGFSGSIPEIGPIDIFRPRYGIDPDAIRSLQDNFFWDYGEDWYGVYFQDQMTIADTFHILGGGRYDWARTGYGLSEQSLAAAKRKMEQDSEFSPRVGVLYQPQEWWSVYGSYTESFGANNGRSTTGTAFSPETATQYEVGLKTNLLDERLQATLALYHLTKHNVLTPDVSTPDPTDSIAIGSVRSRGIEYDIAGQLTQNLSLIGSYAFTDIRITRDNSGNKGRRFASVPLHSGSLWAKYEIDSGYFSGLSFGGGIFLRSKRQGDNANTFQLPGYTRLDAVVAYRFAPFGTPVTVQFNIYNLTDKTYYDRSSNRLNVHPGEPVNFLGSIRWEF